jgi:hypothetical protein
VEDLLVRVLFTVPPALGHLFPVVCMAWAARTAGHEVVLASSGAAVTEAVRAGLCAVDVAPDADFAAAFGSTAGSARQRADESASLLILEASPKFGSEAIRGWDEAGLTVRTVRGRKMRTMEALFDEVAAALQFPQYFGENWSAFDECLADMDWLPVNAGIVIMISDANEVLADSADDQLGTFVRAIAHAAKTYAEPIEVGEWWDRPAIPFHVVLLSTPDNTTTTRSRWGAAEAKITEFGGSA